MKALTAREEDLRPNFGLQSVFSCAALNLGPTVVCTPHKDCNNCPFGWCSILALGNFEAKAGGQIVLWEMGLIIDFPPGATILIPSALVTHWNLPIGSQESRSSFTQFTPGNIFRYVENGFRTDAELRDTDTDQYRADMEGRLTRWENKVNMFYTKADLLEMWKPGLCVVRSATN
jgi:hypothetical protein